MICQISCSTDEIIAFDRGVPLPNEDVLRQLREYRRKPNIAKTYVHTLNYNSGT